MQNMGALIVALVVAITNGEERRSDDIRSATIELSTGSRFVQYSVVGGLAIFEGDIVLGKVAELEQAAARERFGGPAADGVALSGSQFRWPNRVIPYTVDVRLPDRVRVTDAIAHWEEKTNVRFVPRTTERDFVTFRPGVGCSSAPGRRGGQQYVTLGEGCARGNVIHEIGHLVGLWHEQSREDRDRFVQINWEKIRAESVHNFNQHISDGQDAGPYDYASIMHYPSTAFSVDGSNTIVPLDPSARIGQRNALSAGDIAAANALLDPPPAPAQTPAAPPPPVKRRSAGRG